MHIDESRPDWYIQPMRITFCLAVLLLFFGRCVWAELDYACIDPVVEVRGIWIDAGAIPRTAQGIRQMVRSYADANINLLLPETICRGYAVYPSAILARDPRFVGTVDPLSVMIDEAHKLNIEVHPWVWVFRAGYTKDKGSILGAHPDWTELDVNGKDLSPNGGYWLSPSNPAARDFLASVYAELARKYDIDGIHLDYIRYETEEKSPYGFSESSTSLFEKQYGTSPTEVHPDSLDHLFWDKFRQRQVNTFVQRIALQTRSIKPRAVVSAAVGAYPPDARTQLLQNWPNWAANKWIDLVTPMAYSTDDAHFGRLIVRQRDAIGCSALLAEGVGLFLHKDPAQTVAQIAMSRQMGAIGQVLFSASYCGQAQLAALRAGPYSRPAMLPFGDPCAAAQRLASQAERCRIAGQTDLADYYATTANDLACYDAYRKQVTPYVPPALPDQP